MGFDFWTFYVISSLKVYEYRFICWNSKIEVPMMDIGTRVGSMCWVGGGSYRTGGFVIVIFEIYLVNADFLLKVSWL